MDKDALWLIEIGDSDPPILAVVEHPFWDDEHLEFYVDESTCPVNLIPVATLIWDGETDPHDLLHFIQQVRKPNDWPFVGTITVDRYSALFDKLPAYLAQSRTAEQ